MRINIDALRNKEMTLAEMVAPFTKDDLRVETDEIIDLYLQLIADCVDADVVFDPVDEDADDPFAEDEAERNIAWNLGHLIVHTTASAEEAAFLAAELARGVENHGRSRYETPWRTVTTMAQLYTRLEESRRMRLATIDVWPDEPHLDVVTELGFVEGPINAYARYVLGLMHEISHIEQTKDVIRQAKAARL